MNETVTVIAEIKAAAGREDEVKALLLDLVAPTHAEAGCINYDLHESSDEKGRFLFHENWRSMKDLEAHFETPHLKEMDAKADHLLAEPVKITLWRKIS